MPVGSVFISYRRATSNHFARAVLLDLEKYDWDVFLDVDDINAGRFDDIILRELEARDNYILIMKQGSLDRIADPDDWVRREIEHALATQRNIIPVLFDGFKFAQAEFFLTGSLKPVLGYNGITVPDDFFVEAMTRLRTRFLKRSGNPSVSASSPTALSTPAAPPQIIAPIVDPPPGYKRERPPLTVDEYFLPVAASPAAAIAAWEQRQQKSVNRFDSLALVYQPVLLAQGSASFEEKRANLFTVKVYAFRVPEPGLSGRIRWSDYAAPPVSLGVIEREQAAHTFFGTLSPSLTNSARLNMLQRDFMAMLRETVALDVPFNEELDLYGEPDGDAANFQTRVVDVARYARNAEIDRLTTLYSDRMDTLDRDLEQMIAKLEQQQANLPNPDSDPTTSDDLSQSMETMTHLTNQIDQLETEFERELVAINDRWAQVAANAQALSIKPHQDDVTQDMFGVGWLPHWYIRLDEETLMLPAYMQKS
jgi:hypothetical protein